MNSKEMRQEIEKAMEFGEAALENLRTAQEKLENVGKWAKFDVLSGGSVTSVVKMSKMKDLQGNIELAKIKIRCFEKELKDIQFSAELRAEIDGFISFADIFFDGAAIDYAVYSQIKELKKQVSDAIYRIEKAMDVLKKRLELKTRDISEIIDDSEKENIARAILEDLQEWFAIPEGRERYIQDSAGKFFICAKEEEKPLGFLYLKQTGKDTVEIAVMGVLKQYHRNGIGRELFEFAKEIARRKGYSFIQVKTVRMEKNEDYDQTNKFFLALGFKEFDVLPALGNEANPCRIYVTAL